MAKCRKNEINMKINTFTTIQITGMYRRNNGKEWVRKKESTSPEGE